MKGARGLPISKFSYLTGLPMLAIGTLCRSGLPGVIIGNTAESVHDSVDCSMLTIKPGNFVSPVLCDHFAAENPAS